MALLLVSFHFQFPFLFLIYITILYIFLFSSYCFVGVYSLSSAWLCDPMDCNTPGSLSIGFFRQNTGASYHFLLKIFPNQGLNLHLLYGFFTAEGGFLSAESLRKPTTVFASFFVYNKQLTSFILTQANVV